MAPACRDTKSLARVTLVTWPNQKMTTYVDTLQVLAPSTDRICSPPRSLTNVVNVDQTGESASGILTRMARDGLAEKKDRPAYLWGRPMAYPKSLRLLIRGRLESGDLTRNGLRRVSGGPGNGESCVACNEIIAKTQFAMEGIGDRLTVLQFHVGCFSLWNVERSALAEAESGASANGHQ